MPVQIVLENNLSCPKVFCDFCWLEIKDAKDGNYEWLMDDQGRIVDGKLFFTHKHCCYPFETVNGGRAHWACMELSILPVYLEKNMKIQHTESTKWAKRLAEL